MLLTAMLSHIASVTVKPVAFFSGVGWLFAQTPEFPIPLDKGIALGLCIWALMSERKSHKATHEEIKKEREEFKTELEDQKVEYKAELKEERGRSDETLNVLKKQITSFDKFTKGFEKLSFSIQAINKRNKETKP